jgi:hypothetical protein
MAFAKDFEAGGKGEILVLNFLKEIGLEPSLNQDKEKRSLFDIYVDKPPLTFEVKFDFMSSVTGNLAIERFNPIKGKASGIDISQADYWVIIVYENKVPIIHMCRREDLLTYMEYNSPFKIVTGGDNQNSNMWLYKKTILLGPSDSDRPIKCYTVEEAKEYFNVV